MILVTLPLTFRAIFDFIRMDSHVIQWLNANMVNGAVYNLSVFVLTTYLPILFQIGTLVFGFVRNKQGKLLQQKGEDNYDEQQQHLTQPISVLSKASFASSAIDSDNGSYFDPPLESYAAQYFNEVDEIKVKMFMQQPMISSTDRKKHKDSVLSSRSQKVSHSGRSKVDSFVES